MMKRMRRGISAVMLVSVTACTTMQPVAQPKDFVQARKPSVVWLTRTSDPAVISMDGPKLEGDSIVGFVEGEFTEIPLSDVKTMQAKQYSRKKTSTFAVIGSALLVGLFFVVKGGVGSAAEENGEDIDGIIRR